MIAEAIQEQTLRQRLEGMETHALVDMWCKQERLPWAETVLRQVLQERGVADAQLDQGRVLAAEREAETVSGQSFVGFAVIGRFIAVLLALAASKFISGLGTPKAGTIVAMAIIATYVGLLVRSLVLASRKRKSDAVVVGMAFMWIEAVLLGCIALLGAITAVTVE